MAESWGGVLVTDLKVFVAQYSHIREIFATTQIILHTVVLRLPAISVVQPSHWFYRSVMHFDLFFKYFLFLQWTVSSFLHYWTTKVKGQSIDFPCVVQVRKVSQVFVQAVNKSSHQTHSFFFVLSLFHRLPLCPSLCPHTHAHTHTLTSAFYFLQPLPISLTP